MTLERPMFPPVDPSRRGFLAQAAVVAAGGAALGVALPLPVAAGSPERVPDPIYAAIERHRRAYQDWMDNLGEDEIEAAVPRELRKSDLVGALHGDSDWQVAGDDPRWIAHIETACRVDTENADAAIELVSFDSISLAGAVALLKYVATVEAKDPGAWPADLMTVDNVRRSWHFFLIDSLSRALRPVTA